LVANLKRHPIDIKEFLRGAVRFRFIPDDFIGKIDNPAYLFDKLLDCDIHSVSDIN
jgi:hypothetical protein